MPRRWRMALGVLLAAALLARPGLAQQPVAGDAGIPVSVAAVLRQDVPVLLRNIGAVQAFQSVMVRPGWTARWSRCSSPRART